MNNDPRQYEDLIRQIEALPQASVPAQFTHTLMEKINGSMLQTLRATFAVAGNLSWIRFANERANGHNAFFNFLIAGLFFLMIGIMLLSSILYIDHPFSSAGFIILQAILIIIAAVSLVTGGLMMAVDGPDSVLWSRRTILIYGFFMMLSALLMAVSFKTSWGGTAGFCHCSGRHADRFFSGQVS